MKLASVFCGVTAVVTIAGLTAASVRAQDDAPRPIRFARFPVLSPDGKQIAFSHQGDIWSVGAGGGRALRLTLHEAHDTNPSWSPDGKWLAFSSRRSGNYDVWVMPSDGGRPRQLTFHSADDETAGWSADGKQLLFSSRREFARGSAIYSVDLTGGNSRLLASDALSLLHPTLSPDGQWLACSRGRDWWRRGYRGSGNSSLMLFPTSGGPGKWLRREAENERWPVFAPDGKHLFFVSDGDGANNLYRTTPDGDRPQRLTSFKDGNLFNPSVARGGELIAFERNFGVWTMSSKGGEAKEISIYAPSDDRTNPVRQETFTSNPQAMAPSPDGKQMAILVHGELFTFPTSGGEAVRVTRTPSREEDVAWSPDGKWLAFSSDRDGDQDLYLSDPTGGTVKPLARTAGVADRTPEFSPDGKKVAFLRGYNGSELCVVELEGEAISTPRVVVRDPAISGVSWSPDGQWLAYARMKSHSAGLVSEVFVARASDGHRVNVSRYPVVNRAPQWSHDGKNLYFLSDRGGADSNLYMTALGDDGGPEGGAGGAGAGDDEPDQNLVKVDEEGIQRRVRSIARAPGGVSGYAVSPDGKSVLYTAAAAEGGRSDLWKVGVTGGAATRLTQTGEGGASLQFTSDGNRLFYVAGGSVKSILPAGGTPAVHAFRAQMEVDVRLELMQMFDEGWRKMRDSFYDEKLHGANWEQVKQTYRPVVPDLTYKEDFYDLFLLVLGELNASHTGISAAGTGTGPATASLGIAPDPTYAGPGVRVGFVMPRSPASRGESRLQVGDHILKINNQVVSGAEEYFRLLNDQSGKSVKLLVNREPKEEGGRTITIRPISVVAYRNLEYERWTREREQQTQELSSGKLTYLHLSAMNDANLERFRRTVFGEGQEKQGLVLDIRFNGGGSIADEMLAILQDRIFSYRTMRGDPGKLPAPLNVFTRPIIVLINEASFSNAEAFPWGFKALKLGKVVGVPTYGGCIGTGATTLIDGSTLRTPTTGAFTLDGINMENNGCPPDIHVENTPADVAAGADRQLERAVQELLKQTGRRR